MILMFLSPLILFTSMIWIGDLDIKNVIVRLLFLMLILVVVIYFVFVYFLPKFSFYEYLSLDVLTKRADFLEYDSDKGSQRLLGYVILYKYIFKDWRNILFGLGVGAIISSKAFDTNAIKIVKTYFPLGATDGVYFMLTIGIIGFLIAIVILLYGIVWIKKYLLFENVPFMRINASAFMAITVMFLLSITYTNVWSTQVGLTYWVFAGVFVNRYGVLMHKKQRIWSF